MIHKVKQHKKKRQCFHFLPTSHSKAGGAEPELERTLRRPRKELSCSY